VPRRPRLSALGLGGRIVGAVLVTTVATLAVAALALLGPLEQGLRNAALKTLAGDVKGAAANFRQLDLKYVADRSKSEGLAFTEGRAERHVLLVQQQALGTRIGATVQLLGYPDVSGHGYLVLLPVDSDATQSNPDEAPVDPYDDVTRVFLTGKRVVSFGSIGDTQYARVALPITIAHQKQKYVLAIRRPIDEVADAVAVVRRAFITAALAGLALTLILGIPLAATLVRRLRRLRQAALRLAHEGPGVEVPVDRARDEVGDLARSLAIMQRKLQQQEEARRAFVATASHELRTPLTSLDGMLELLDDDLLDEPPDLEDARALLERARAQSRRLGRLAADLLDLSRLDAEVELRSEPVELGELSRAVLAEFELGTTERGIIPQLEDSAGPVWALGDPGSVARILRILLDNAFRLSPGRSEITVELKRGSEVTLSVRDQGPGVPPDERDQIFQRFHRGRQTGGQGGFGLGLAIGRELAERMGGELVLEDTPGSGAKFTLKLPAARAPDQDPVAVG
jgi:signal transduction histidine kinase